MTHADLAKILRHADAEDQRDLPFPEDCRLIKRIVEERYGVSISLTECRGLWEMHSSKQCAQWLDPKQVTPQEICEAAVAWAKSFFVCDPDMVLSMILNVP